MFLWKLHLTEEGRKYFRDASPEARFPSDSLGIYIMPEIEPTRWEAYLCVERRALHSDTLPGKPPVARAVYPDSYGDYRYLEDPGKGSCQFVPVGYFLGKGFLFSHGFSGVGTLKIRYR